MRHYLTPNLIIPMEELVNNKYRNVLIIDDDDDDCALIAETLHEIDSQIKCVCMKDGRVALAYVVETENLPDIIFLDLHMPKMNGLEFLKVLKSDPELLNIPVVICTDSKIADEMEECKKMGAAEFIMKPSSFLLIKYEIRKALMSIAGSMITEVSKA